MDDDIPNPFEDGAGSQSPEVTPEVSTNTGVEPALTGEMKVFIDKNWTSMDLMEMTRHVFKNDNLKGSSREGRIVRDYLVAKGFQYKTTKEPKREVTLTEENKEFIMQYAREMKPYEIARVVFKDEKLQPSSKEALTVQTFIKSSSPTLLKKDDEYTDDEYTPPKTFRKAFERIKELTGLNVEEEKINVKTRKCVEKCLEFTQAPRFVQTVTNLKNISERAIFESEFIRSVWDKPDLTTDEINLYISLTNEYVIQDRLHRIMGKLNMLLEGVTEDKDGKISMALSDSIKGKSEELHRSLSRQQDFTTLLTGKRANRLQAQIQRQKSLVSLVEAMRDEDDRKAALRFANMRKKKVEDELTRLENEDEWNARIFGISKEEILE